MHHHHTYAVRTLSSAHRDTLKRIHPLHVHQATYTFTYIHTPRRLSNPSHFLPEPFSKPPRESWPFLAPATPTTFAKPQPLPHFSPINPPLVRDARSARRVTPKEGGKLKRKAIDVSTG
ncbi:hypothetical protein B0T21DRAFT_21727 [Apiosordaria backusii]|uniref:Uncharacterized protein n=1 Tax=Apiosordaria backusii TaxID=314023 RepID=A0AA40K743_9PEZI|nr:hypothetical protein B0T21DRAFT_21727 [Apiosordaria backusii]